MEDDVARGSRRGRRGGRRGGRGGRRGRGRRGRGGRGGRRGRRGRGHNHQHARGRGAAEGWIGLLRTERFELHALNETAESWDAWLRTTDAWLPPPRAAWLADCGVGEALGGGIVWPRLVAPRLLDARAWVASRCDVLHARAELLERRPALFARPVPTLVDGVGYVDDSDGRPTSVPRMLVVDPLVSSGVDQLSAVPTMNKRLALAASEMGIALDAVQWATRASNQSALASRATETYLASHYQRAYVIGGEVGSVPALRIANGLEAQGSSMLYDGVLCWADRSVQIVDRLARTIAFRRRTWAVSYLGMGGRHVFSGNAHNFSAGAAARVAEAVANGHSDPRADTPFAASAAPGPPPLPPPLPPLLAAVNASSRAVYAADPEMRWRNVEVFAAIAVFRGDVMAASLRASRSLDADGRLVRWRWPALASASVGARCEAAARVAVQALDLKNGVFGMSLMHEPQRGGGGSCAFKSVEPRPHQWPSLSDGAMQLFFQRDLWLDEVVALMLANGDDPTPAMRSATTPPLQLDATCDLKYAGNHGHLAKRLLYPEWLVSLAVSGVCHVILHPID